MPQEISEISIILQSKHTSLTSNIFMRGLKYESHFNKLSQVDASRYKLLKKNFIVS